MKAISSSDLPGSMFTYYQEGGDKGSFIARDTLLLVFLMYAQDRLSFKKILASFAPILKSYGNVQTHKNLRV